MEEVIMAGMRVEECEGDDGERITPNSQPLIPLAWHPTGQTVLVDAALSAVLSPRLSAACV